jgi:hypothetical protein
VKAAHRAECDGTAAAALAASSLSQAAAAAAAAEEEEEEEEKVFGLTFRLVMTMRSAIIFCSRNIVCINQNANKINYFITISGPKFSSHMVCRTSRLHLLSLISKFSLRAPPSFRILPSNVCGTPRKYMRHRAYRTAVSIHDIYSKSFVIHNLPYL